MVLQVPRMSIPNSVSKKEGLCLLEPRSAAAQVRSISEVSSPFLPAPSGYSSSPHPPLLTHTPCSVSGFQTLSQEGLLVTYPDEDGL